MKEQDTDGREQFVVQLAEKFNACEPGSVEQQRIMKAVLTFLDKDEPDEPIIAKEIA